MKYNKSLIPLAAAAGLLGITGTASAATTATNTQSLKSNGFLILRRRP